MIAADTNLFVYAANPASDKYAPASRFFASMHTNPEFVVCELVLVELYIQLRNPAVMPRPLGAESAARVCQTLKQHPTWQHIDYNSEVFRCFQPGFEGSRKRLSTMAARVRFQTTGFVVDASRRGLPGLAGDLPFPLF